MENKEMKEPRPEEVDEEALEDVNGGVTRQLPNCPKCGKTAQACGCSPDDIKNVTIIQQIIY